MNRIQRAAERHLVDVLARMIVRKGYTVCVDSGGLDAGGQVEYDLEKSSDPRAIVEAVYAVDTCTLMVRNSGGPLLGVILLVLGNSPEEVVADHSTSEPIRSIVDSWSVVADAVSNLLSDCGQ